MRVNGLWARLRQKRTLHAAGIIAGIVVVFGLVVLAGNGSLRIMPA